MKVPQDDEERPLAWTAIVRDTPIFSSDGEKVGTVGEVIGSEADDIFHGLLLSSVAQGHDSLIPAENVKAITNRQIETNLTAEQLKNLQPFREEPSYHLGFVGLLGKRLGWVEDGRDES